MLEINLLPEFGWSIKNEPVYGPGSVFQGFVKIKLSEEELQQSQRLRVIFHATETSFSSAEIMPMHRNQLFGSQRVLWRRQDTDSSQKNLEPDTEAIFPFIIELPMIQFPPSSRTVSSDKMFSYQSDFVLSVFLDPTNGKEPIMKSHKSVLYMPFVETMLFKKPVIISPKSSQGSSSESDVTVSMSAMDYLPGDAIQAKMLLKNAAKSQAESVSVKLYQIQTWKKVPDMIKKGKVPTTEKKYKQLIASNTIKLFGCKDQGQSSNKSISSTFDISLPIPVETAPSFSYSPIFSIGYQLQISIKQKKIWSTLLELPDIPIIIGTLGYGIRSSQELKVYSAFKSVFDQGQDNTDALPVPRYLQVVEYEDCLPPYENQRLPLTVGNFGGEFQ
ncbi:hypothetical protein RMCBS344292_08728 [Rhizopus microsporus]|nr:hypothetical protein RMCBS344292_08728 [Rhizopus microsporus]